MSTPKSNPVSGTSSSETCVTDEATSDIPSHTAPDLAALIRAMLDKRAKWDPHAPWPSPEIMRLVQAQDSWRENGSVGDSPLAVLLKSLDEKKTDALLIQSLSTVNKPSPEAEV